MGTRINLSIPEANSEAIFKLLFNRAQVIEKRMSSQYQDSEVSQINRQAGLGFVRVSADTFLVIKTALEIAQRSNGAFNPALGPMIQLWDIGGDNARVPAPKEIEALLGLIDYKQVSLNEPSLSVKLEKSGMRLDLGAIAKGYAADELIKIAKEAGVKRAIFDLGGNIFVFGSKTGTQAWRIGIQRPDQDRGSLMGILEARDLTLVTSGNYERYFEQDGKRYHHILDSKTGAPSQSDVDQVSIISNRSSMYCDALSTTCFVLGREKGLKFMQQFPDYQAVFVGKDRKLVATGNFDRALLIDLESDFTWAPQQSN